MVISLDLPNPLDFLRAGYVIGDYIMFPLLFVSLFHVTYCATAGV